MTGRSAVESMRKRLNDIFKRADALTEDAELLSHFARYLCVLVSGFLEQAVVELIMEHVRQRSAPSVQSHVEAQLRRFTNAKSQKLIELMGSFDQDWHREMQSYLVDDKKDAVDSVVDLRNTISHGRSVGVTINRIRDYYKRVNSVIDHIDQLCTPKS